MEIICEALKSLVNASDTGVATSGGSDSEVMKSKERSLLIDGQYLISRATYLV